jgi:peptidylprolyl isomerase
MPPLMDPIPYVHRTLETLFHLTSLTAPSTRTSSDSTLPEITHRMFMDIDIDAEPAGRILIGLFGANAPEAAENFRRLATCTASVLGDSATPLCYKNTPFHRIIPHFAIQGGDITHHTGVGGIAAIETPTGTYLPRMFNVTKFNRPYMLAVATPNHLAARSQFFITTVKAQWLTGHYTIFGMILEGTDVIGEMERQGTYGGRPQAPVVIRDCGELPLQPEDLEPHYQ